MAVAAVVSLTGIVRGFENSLLELYQQKGIDLIVHQAGRVQMTASSLPQSLETEMLSVPGVVEVYPSLLDVISLIDDDIMGITIQGWPDDSLPLKDLRISSGRPFQAGDRRVVAIGDRLAAAINKNPGDTIELLEAEPFEIIGIFESYNVFESGSLVTRLPDLQELMLRDNEVTMFAIVTKDGSPTEVQAVKEKLQTIAAGIEANPVRELADQSTEIKMARGFAWVTSMIALAIGSIGMLNTLMMAVFERTREIAMLRALGWRRRRIVTLILGEATMLCITGAIIGILIAIVAVQVLSRVPAAGRMISGSISIEVMVQGFVIAILLGLIGGLYPAWSAAKMAPVEGLRHD
jgi:putative ABC transport system permease protein